MESKEKAAAAVFNEWMRRFTEEPEKFRREWEAVIEFLRQSAAGTEPTYGASCVVYMAKLATEMGLTL